MNKEIRKITLSAVLIVLTIVVTRFLSIQNIPVLPFVRISFGPSLIIFSSVVLGPIYGGVIGGASDLFGILLFPNSLGFALNPLITVSYTILGVLPYFIYKYFVNKINEKVKLLIIIISYCLLFGFSIISMFFISPFNEIDLWIRLVLIGVILIIAVGSLLASKFIQKSFGLNGDMSIRSILLVSLLSEIISLCFINSLAKTITFELNYTYLLLASFLVTFINVVLDLFVFLLLQRVVKKIN